MNPRIVCLILVCIGFFDVFGQARLDLYTQRMLKNAPPEKTTIDLFVRGDFDAVKQAVQLVKGTYKYGYGEYSAVTIPLVSLDAFLSSPAIRGVQSGERQELVALTDTALIVNCVLPVHNGDFPLDQPYLGDGVIIGIIDFGIDFNHPDFKKSNGESRIRFLWDQNDTTFNSPIPYHYGREWNEFEINAGECTHAEPGYPGEPATGHGTTVSGIAAGNGRGCNGHYMGMAPNADMIVVAFNFAKPFLSTFIDAVDYIFKKADAMGKPCVINASVGTYGGSHDGKDAAGLMVDAMLEERAGRVLVCAAGNEGNFPFHLGYDVNSDTAFTWFKYNPDPQISDVYFELWADTQDFNNVNFAIGVDDPSTWETLARSQFYNVLNDFNFSISSGDTVATVVYIPKDSTTFLGSVTIKITRARGVYDIEVRVQGIHDASDYWSFITTGSGRIDGWNTSHPDIKIFSSDAVSVLPDSSLRPDIVHYKLPDTLETIVSSFTCSDKVIAVGNFTNRKSYLNCDMGYTVNNNTPGKIFFSSSHGPTRTGLIKPDISATGDFTVAAGNASVIARLLTGERYKVAYCCNYMRNGGTSMASPIVAGIAALYLEKNPDADWREVRDAIMLSARTDSFTGAVPNNSYGYGKVSGCAAMMMDVAYGCTDTAAANYDPDAERDDGSCIAKIYGCMDSTAFNFNPEANTAATCVPRIHGCMDSLALNYDSLANTDNDSCYYVGIGRVANEDIKLVFIPSFFRNETKIIYDFNKPLPGTVSIIFTNSLGQKTDELILPQEKGTVIYQPVSPQSGIYFYHLAYGGKTLLSGKLVIY